MRSKNFVELLASAFLFRGSNWMKIFLMILFIGRKRFSLSYSSVLETIEYLIRLISK